MYVDMPGYYDVDNGEFVKGNVGEIKMIPTRVRLMPTQKGKDHKFMPWPDKETVRKGVMSGKDELRWYVQAVILGDVSNRNRQRNILIPYDQISNDLKAKFGFDLNDRDEKDLSPLEVIQIINEENPDATKEEKAVMFREYEARINGKN